MWFYEYFDNNVGVKRDSRDRRMRLIASDGSWSHVVFFFPRSCADWNPPTAAIRRPTAGFGSSLKGRLDARENERLVSPAALPVLTYLLLRWHQEQVRDRLLSHAQGNGSSRRRLCLWLTLGFPQSVGKSWSITDENSFDFDTINPGRKGLQRPPERQRKHG